MKDTPFFNAESTSYSAKRYPEKATTFTQFFFKARLARTLNCIGSVLMSRTPTSVLELGCADGIVAHAVSQEFGNRIEIFDAVDIAPEMISAAKTLFAQDPITFSVRPELLMRSYDLIIETGVLNYLDLEKELPEVAAALPQTGRYICSIAAKSSLQNRLKGAVGYRHLRSYREYEAAFAGGFEILGRYPVGIFVPYLWKLPAVARIIQPAIEGIVGTLVPAWAHEHIYVLKKR